MRLVPAVAARYGRDTNGLEFRILGPLQVLTGGSTVPLGGAKQRAVLALLLLRANTVVAVDRLIDEVWGDTPPASAPNMLQGYVSQLRKALGADRIVSTPPGYLLHVSPNELDADRFRAGAREAQRLLELGDAAGAATRAREALAEWRGPPLADLELGGSVEPEMERLDELRLVALESRIDADLAQGRADVLVPELRELVAQHPLRERLRAQLMTALYRAGRQAEALEVYRDARRTFAGQLGIEPSPLLRELERAILQHDPDLRLPPRSSQRTHRRRRGALLVGAAGAAVAAGLGIAAATRSGSAETARVVVVPHSVAVVDPAKNAVVADIPVGGWPGPIAADARYVYVSNIGDGTVSRILPHRFRQLDSASFSRAIDLVAHGGDLWAANGGAPAHTPLGVGPGTLLHYSPGPVWRTVRVGPELVGDEEQTTLASDGRGAVVWAGNADARTITELDASTGRKLLTLHGIAPGGLAVVARGGTDIVWATEPQSRRVSRIDERLRRVVARIAVPGKPARVAADAGAVWLVTRGPHSALWRIDPATNRLVARIPLSIAPLRIAVGAGSVWVGGRGGELVRVAPETNTIVQTIGLGRVATDGILVSHGLVWVAAPPRSSD